MINCKICKNLRRMVLESDEYGNIVKFIPNKCKVSNREIIDITLTCHLKGCEDVD